MRAMIHPHGVELPLEVGAAAMVVGDPEAGAVVEGAVVGAVVPGGAVVAEVVGGAVVGGVVVVGEVVGGEVVGGAVVGGAVVVGPSAVVVGPRVVVVGRAMVVVETVGRLTEPPPQLAAARPNPARRAPDRTACRALIDIPHALRELPTDPLTDGTWLWARRCRIPCRGTRDQRPLRTESPGVSRSTLPGGVPGSRAGRSRVGRRLSSECGCPATIGGGCGAGGGGRAVRHGS
jgi:hypothetical protein